MCYCLHVFLPNLIFSHKGDSVPLRDNKGFINFICLYHIQSLYVLYTDSPWSLHQLNSDHIKEILAVLLCLFHVDGNVQITGDCTLAVHPFDFSLTSNFLHFVSVPLHCTAPHYQNSWYPPSLTHPFHFYHSHTLTHTVSSFPLLPKSNLIISFSWKH